MQRVFLSGVTVDPANAGLEDRPSRCRRG